MALTSNISFKFEDGKNIFFTSDTHFGHKNIIKYCKRPFESVEEMNEKLIKNWNSVVGPDDIVFHLGDFVFGGSKLWNDVLDRLNGKIYLIIGNHDEHNLKGAYMDRFEWYGYQAHIYVEGKSIYLNHYPMLCYHGAWNGLEACWQLFGHVHSSPLTQEGLDVKRLTHLFPTQYDVGVDNNNFTPISFEQVRQIIEDQQMSLNLIK